jgi:hypothetical protein
VARLLLISRKDALAIVSDDSLHLWSFYLSPVGKKKCTSVVGLRAEIKGTVMDTGEKGIQWIGFEEPPLMVLYPLIIGSPDVRTIADNSFCVRVPLQFYRASNYKSHHACNKGGQAVTEPGILTKDVEFYRKHGQ